MSKQTVAGINPLLVYINNLMQFFNTQTIKVPGPFPDKVCAVKKVLTSDVSGMVNSILDFAISVADVDYKVETANKNLSAVLNEWLYNINDELRGKIPTGIRALAKEYHRERWQKSSLLLMRTLWEKRDGFELPTKIWFVDGQNVRVEDSETVSIGEEKYRLQITKKKSIALPNKANEMIFVQKPYESWGVSYPVPYIIRRGIYKNLMLLDLMVSKGEGIVAKSLEYLLMIKKGTEQLAKTGNADFIYSEEDLKKIKNDFSELVDTRGQGGIPTYTTQFDTDIEHLIPDYEKAVKQALYTPIERRILAGLGLIEIVEGISSTRKEGILNPRPFIGEVKSSVADFASLMDDLVTEIIVRNKKLHRKYTNNLVTIHTSPIKQLLDEDFKTMLRSIYDRGGLSIQTLTEVVGDIDFNIEVERRKREQTDGIEKIMAPHPVRAEETSDTNVESPKKEELNLEDQDKQGPEKLNFQGKKIKTKIKKTKKK